MAYNRLGMQRSRAFAVSPLSFIMSYYFVLSDIL